MILISHRGNIDCVLPEQENSPAYIERAILLGYDVEIDIRLIDGKIYLGHDFPQYEISFDWLLDKRQHLWVHTKNFKALSFLIDKEVKTFFHQKEKHTIINNCNLIWSHELSEANEKSIIPLLSIDDINRFRGTNVYGICSDFVSTLKEKL